MQNLDSIATHRSLLGRLRTLEDEQAWSEFVGHYREPIAAFCRGVFQADAETAEDVAQEVLIKIVRAMRANQYDPAKSFRKWLKAVTGNAMRDVLRARSRELTHGSGDSEILALLQQVPAQGATEELIGRLSTDFRRDLLSAVAIQVEQRVDQQTWRAYQMTVGGMPAAKVAESVGLSVPAIYQARSRIKHMLRQEISKLLLQQSESD